MVRGMAVWSSYDLQTWTLRTAAASWSVRWGLVLESFNNSLVVVGGETITTLRQPFLNDVSSRSSPTSRRMWRL
jgi:hypothetical protein